MEFERFAGPSSYLPNYSYDVRKCHLNETISELPNSSGLPMMEELYVYGAFWSIQRRMGFRLRPSVQLVGVP